jgi:large subunit ribosomal protein L5
MKEKPNILQEKYEKEVVPILRAKFGYKNIMAVPKIEKVVVNVGIGKALKENNPKLIERIKRDIAVITGQKAAHRKAKKSIAGFKLRQGMVVGYQVTLRGRRMYDFLNRLVSVALPRVRDFRGLGVSLFDSSGNLNIGIKEQSIFPEIEFESSKDIFSMQVTITTTASKKEEGIELLKLIGFPIK